MLSYTMVARKEVEQKSRKLVKFRSDSATEASTPLLIPYSCRAQVAHWEAILRL